VVVNIGCAEGFYAIGMARRLPNATVYAIDVNDDCVRIAKQAAEANGVNIIFGKTLDEVFAKPDLLIVDCEGYERDYLDPKKFPSLAAATMLVEVHNHGMLDNDDALRVNFKDTHSIGTIFEGGRNPNVYPILYKEPSNARWAAVSENRPCMMYWFLIKPFDTPSRSETDIPLGAAKVCGECNLCCKLEKVMWLNKPSNTWCEHCDIGVGCKIYENRPPDCSAFQCLWLRSPDMPDELRPDKVHHYAAGSPKGGYLKVCVDTEYPDVWKDSPVVKYVTGKGFHALVQVGHQVNFVKGEGKQMPLKLMLDWTL
jgi:hypothetical protein